MTTTIIDTNNPNSNTPNAHTDNVEAIRDAVRRAAVDGRVNVRWVPPFGREYKTAGDLSSNFALTFILDLSQHGCSDIMPY